MSAHFSPLTCKEVKKILTNLHFVFRSQKGSHEQWVKIENGRIYKVTVDCPKEPFTHQLIKYMAQQAGVSKKNFYRAFEKKEANKILSANHSITSFQNESEKN